MAPEYQLVFPFGIMDEVRRLLRDPQDKERVLFLAAGVSTSPRMRRLLVRRIFSVPEEDLAPGEGGLTLRNPRQLARAVAYADAHGLSLIDVHTHTGSPQPMFSAVDTATHIRLAQHFARFWGATGKRLYGNVVLGSEGMDARVWDLRHNQPVAVSVVKALDRPLEEVVPTSRARMIPGGDERFVRQSVFGAVSQQRLENLRVGIVGYGGIGSPVFEQLCRLGVRNIVLVEPDAAEVSNYHRLIGASWRQIQRNSPKVLIARRHARRIHPAIHVSCWRGPVQSPGAVRALKDCDVIVSCVDSHAARQFLAQLGAKHLIPVIDTGVGIAVDEHCRPDDIGGRLLICLPGDVCLECIPGGYDRRLAAFEELPADVQGFWTRSGYVRGGNVAAPQVVHFDGQVARYAVMQLHAWASGFSDAANVFVFDFLHHSTKHALHTRPSDTACLSCSDSGLLALGDLEPFQFAGVRRQQQKISVPQAVLTPGPE